MFKIFAYLRYFLYCVNLHSLHSPLVYDLYRKVIKPRKKLSLNTEYEKIRTELIRSKQSILLTDFGTGAGRTNTRAISGIAKLSLTDGKRSRLLQALAEYFECKNLVELGTSLGINSLYLSDTEQARLTTFEGSDALADIAKKKFTHFNKTNIRIVRGNIDTTLPDFLSRSEKLDFVYFDANHAYRPTINYYTWCRNRCHDETVFVFDDIHYSKEMEMAWKEICSYVEVTMSIDLFHMGIILFDPSLSKQHFILEY